MSIDRNTLLNDPETAMRYALDGRQAQMWTAMPAIVTSVNRVAMTLECQPAILGVQTNPDNSETFVKMPLLLDVPICFPSAGGFTLTLPINIGDEILVVLASRCIDGWWQSGTVGVPVETRMHDLSDGFAIPGPKSLPKAATLIGGISSTNAQLRTDDGLCYIELTPVGGINMVAPTGVHIHGDLVVTGEVTGGLLPIPLTTHVHSGVSTGGGNSGPPV